MKTGIIIVFCLLNSIIFNAQTPAWFINSSEAKAYAVDNNVPILIVFAGSDWCKPCMELKSTILTSDAFTKYYPAHFALLYLDFPIQKKNQLSPALKKQNDALAAKYNTSGFYPYMVMISVQGEILGNLSFRHQSPKEFMQECDVILNKTAKK